MKSVKTISSIAERGSVNSFRMEAPRGPHRAGRGRGSGWEQAERGGVPGGKADTRGTDFRLLSQRMVSSAGKNR